MCNYCNPEYLNIDRMEIDSDKSEYSPSMFMEIINGEICLLCVSEDITYYRPRFCPECGRKLI